MMVPTFFCSSTTSRRNLANLSMWTLLVVAWLMLIDNHSWESCKGSPDHRNQDTLFYSQWKQPLTPPIPASLLSISCCLILIVLKKNQSGQTKWRKMAQMILRRQKGPKLRFQLRRNLSVVQRFLPPAATMSGGKRVCVELGGGFNPLGWGGLVSFPNPLAVESQVIRDGSWLAVGFWEIIE